MKKSLSHLPEHKRDELRRITETIRQMAPRTEMVILFGSHARGDWVEDVYKKGHTTYEYSSDYDILVIVEKNKIANSTNMWHAVRRRIRKMSLQSWTTLIVNDLAFVNKRLRQGQYFFTDIKKDGIMLYDSGNFKLQRRRKLNLEQRADIAKAEFKHWLKTAREFMIDFNNAFKRRSYKKAAFELHQATEAFYSAVLLVFTNYRPKKTHDLETLSHMAGGHNAEFLSIFPQAQKEQKRCFDLLNDAYVKARYDPRYKITKKELEYLAPRIRKLQRLTKKICKEKIESFV